MEISSLALSSPDSELVCFARSPKQYSRIDLSPGFLRISTIINRDRNVDTKLPYHIGSEELTRNPFSRSIRRSNHESRKEKLAAA